MSRRLAREVAIQALYQQEIHPDGEGSVLKEMEKQLTPEHQEFYKQMTAGVVEHKEEIDPYIERYLKKTWTLNRISAVDRAVLRLAVYELLYQKETPHGVVLNEAVDLAKSFGGDEAGRFVNGVLGNIVDELGE